jgi:peroxiredoxin Q/BCP
MKLEPGQIAPAFVATSYEGEKIELERYRGRKLWLGFYRFASCPLCNNRIHEVIRRHGEFQRQGIELLAVFQSPPERIAQYVGRQSPPFPLIADPELELYGRYGVVPRTAGMFAPRVFTGLLRALGNGFRPGPSEGPKAMIPADFFIDPEGLLWDVYYGEVISDHVPFSRVAAFGADANHDAPGSSSDQSSR